MSEHEDQDVNGKGRENIVDIGAAKARKQRGLGPKPDKGDKETARREYMAALSGCPVIWPLLPRKFKVLCDDAGVRTFIEISRGNVVTHVPHTTVRDALVAYNQNTVQPLYPDTAALSTRDALEIATRWSAAQVPVLEHEIPGVREKSEPGLCWQRLDFDLAEGPTPLFDEFLSRTSNARALQVFIGSLLVKEADRQQYVWLWGHGLNGKGSLTRFLKSILGPSYRAELPPSRDSRFWTAGLRGARLVCFSDLDRKDEDFVTTGLFKSLTGGDPVRVELKGGAVTTAELCAKYLFGSNSLPKIGSGIADMRRTIICKIEDLPPGTKVRHDYGKLLEAEGPAFLWSCRQAYAEDCPNHGPIPADMLPAEELAANNEADLEEAFERYLEPVNRGAESEGNLRGTTLGFMAAMFQELGWNGRQQARFYEWAEQKHQAVRRRPHGKRRLFCGTVPSKWAAVERAKWCEESFVLSYGASDLF